MRIDLAASIVAALVVGLVAATEVGYISGAYAAALAGAVVVSALMFSFAKGIPQTEAVMAEGGGDSIKIKAFGAEGEFHGPNIVSRLVGSNILTNILLIVVLLGLFYHDSANTDAQKRVAAAIEVSNYITVQPEDKRLEIGKRMAEPEALRRLYR